ncbi:MAG: flagellar hook-basal body protein [Sedimentibacter sp.]|uniref:flagellar hook-basal body protein n=1 Tax=Sedimentibacter sp. TaxID=1960295 RepID=UPI0031593377
MIRAYYTAVNGATGNQNYLDVISNNMANIQTEGFKKSKAEFSDLLYTNIRGNEGEITNLKAGSGSRLNKSDVNFQQGALYSTGVQTDFAIAGDGFFAVQFEDENMYTRGGSFKATNVDGEIFLTYQGGYVLNDEEEPIILENGADNISVGVFKFANNSDLAQEGSNLYRVINEDAEYSMSEDSRVMQGFLESSNVDMAEEMVRLLTIQRSFQLNSNVIQTADEIEQTINSLSR